LSSALFTMQLFLVYALVQGRCLTMRTTNWGQRSVTRWSAATSDRRGFDSAPRHIRLTTTTATPSAPRVSRLFSH